MKLDISKEWCIEAAKREGDSEIGAGFESLSMEPPMTQPEAEGETPAALWREKGEADPHGDRYNCRRDQLVLGKFTDDHIANAVFLIPDIANLTAAKDRIRWLSRQNASLTRQLAEARAERERMRQRILKCADDGLVSWNAAQQICARALSPPREGEPSAASDAP